MSQKNVLNQFHHPMLMGTSLPSVLIHKNQLPRGERFSSIWGLFMLSRFFLYQDAICNDTFER